MKNIVSRTVCAALAAMLVLIPGAPAQAQLGPLSARLPAGSNAVMAVDVAKLLQSPMAKEQELQSKLIAGYADRPLAVPGTAKRVVVGAAIQPAGMQSIWQAA
jgi:hypothetical protein